MRVAAAPVLFALALVLVPGCGDDLPGRITILTGPGWEPALRELAALTPYTGLSVNTAPGDGYRIDVLDDPAIPLEGYRLEHAGDTVRVMAHDVLGAQYGVAAALESLGFRFRHPFDPRVPHTPTLEAVDEQLHAPDIRIRGFQFHTLHPIEAYFAFWEPSPTSTTEAHQIIDWVIKNRGNYVQWVPVDDIMDPARHAAWKAFTRELLDYAHARGVRVGLNIQLFGQSNLQQAFDLSDDESGLVPIADEIAARLPLITEGLPFDVYHLSFGEFFNADPDRFIGAVNEVRAQLRVLAPAAEMHGLIHVGAEQRVAYQGEELLYYFLVKYADPSIIPDVHTVMFYNLFEDAGGAYHHDRFDEHLAYLRERMCAGLPSSYLPETAYWIAFDNSVPQLLPIYVHNRWLDLHELRRVPGPCGTLDQHILFSSGWEWGYWLHDVTALRASYDLPASPRALLEDQLAPDLGIHVAAIVDRLAHLQRDALQHRRLIAYLAGRDSVIDLGDTLGILAQPDRITFDDLIASGDVAGFRAGVHAPLTAYADRLDGLATELRAFTLPDTRWAREIVDGFRIDQLRARFVLALYAATMASIEGDAATARDQHEAATALLEEARRVVTARHADLHALQGRRLVEETTTRTTFQYGYLRMADTVCYWERELTQVAAILGNTTVVPPSCFF